jgi:hypothetical protein
MNFRHKNTFSNYVFKIPLCIWQRLNCHKQNYFTIIRGTVWEFTLNQHNIKVKPSKQNSNKMGWTYRMRERINKNCNRKFTVLLALLLCFWSLIHARLFQLYSSATLYLAFWVEKYWRLINSGRYKGYAWKIKKSILTN